MRPALLVFAVYACVQTASEDVQPARLFNSGLTFAEFIGRAKAQRETWRENASRTDVPDDAVNRLKRVRNGLRVLIVAEDWCADSAHTVPYIANLAAAAGVDLRIIDRAAGTPIMSAHRTRDGRPVTPTVVLLRHDRDVGAWVERPAALQRMFFAIAANPDAARQFAERATWYDEDRGRTTIAEFVELAERTAGK
jgi:Thioredoxin